MTRTDVMLTYVPLFLREAKAYKGIINAQGPEFDTIRTNMEDILKQFYVETATGWGLDLWEQMLGLKSYAGKPDDQRRSRIISKLRGMGTVNVTLIKNVAESYVYGAVEVTENSSAYSFTIKFVDTRGIPPNLDDVEAAIEEIKPAHLAVNYQFTYLYWNELDVSPHTWDDVDARAMTWDEFELWKP